MASRATAELDERPRAADIGRRKPPPPAFAEVFIRWGWRGVETVYGSRTSCNKRWVGECGGDRLIAARLAYRARLRALQAEQSGPYRRRP